MDTDTVLQGRKITADDMEQIRRLLSENPSWHRTRLSQEICSLWNWRNTKGQLKDMACRTLLLKLEQQGKIVLPCRQRSSMNELRGRSIAHVQHSTEPIHCSLQELLPLKIGLVRESPGDGVLFKFLLSRYHYLGYRNSVGENLKYVVRGCDGRPLGCLLFGSAAWKTRPRDSFIGWDPETRKRNLFLITNNMRFLILEWVRVPHLASYILARIARRISGDWCNKYGHRIWLLETFVDRNRFRGTCYRASNWIHVGATKGRSRNDRTHSIRVSVKDIYLYPLTKQFRRELTRE